jgi:signal recognition particle receptor subunit alpha
VNNPDKIIFVGEALVGNEAVDQLTKFDRALRDFSSVSGIGTGRGIDGMLVTKWDTVDDKVGSFTRDSWRSRLISCHGHRLGPRCR